MFKKILTVSLLLITLCGCAALKIRKEEINLVKNGTLDKGTNFWNTWQPEEKINFRYNHKERSLEISSQKDFSMGTWYQPIRNFNHSLKYRASALIKAEKIVPKIEWAGVHLRVEFWKDGRWIEANSSATLTGTFDWQRINFEFQIPPEADELRICPYLFDAMGKVYFKDLSIVPSKPKPRKKLIKNVDLDIYGGLKKIKGEKSGFFHTQKINGRWWIIDPEGNIFISLGVNAISYKGDMARGLGYAPYGKLTKRKYGSPSIWAKNTIKRLKSIGFNTIGSWSDKETFTQGMAYTKILYFADGAMWQGISAGNFADVFSDEFKEYADLIASQECKRLKDDPYLLGYFLDNEMKWLGGWDKPIPLLDAYMEKEKDSKGKRAAIDFLKSRYKEIEKFKEVYILDISNFEELVEIYSLPVKENKMKQALDDKNAFLKLVAEKYFATVYEVIKKYDPNHMILGARFAYYAPEAVWKASSKYVDINSINIYDHKPSKFMLEKYYRFSGKPIMITEFSFKAMDSGLPNTRGAGWPLLSQRDRAKGYENYISRLIELPFIVGFHWFKFTDQPKEGRALPDDGENSNYGIVTINDEVYRILAHKMKRVNESIYNLALSQIP
jgi:agarase